MRYDPGRVSRFDDEQVAEIAYAALRQLREAQGCHRGPVWGLLVKEERAWYARAVGRAARGCTPRTIHDEWRREMLDAGWVPGPEIDHVKRTHPELYPWEALGGPVRRRFFLVQMVTMAMYLEVPPALTVLPPVTAL